MEEEHNQMGDVEHIRTQRAEIREKMRVIEQDIERLRVRRSFLFRLPLSKAHLFRHYVLRVTRNESTAA